MTICEYIIDKLYATVKNAHENNTYFQGILAWGECTYSDLTVVRDLSVSKLAMELAPDPGIKPLRTTPGISLLAMVKESTTPASVSLSLRIFIQRSDTITLESKATKANEPMTPAKTTEPTQMESTSSNSGSETKKKMHEEKVCVIIDHVFRETQIV